MRTTRPVCFVVLGVAAALLAAVPGCARKDASRRPAGSLVARHAAGALPALEPLADAWTRAPEQVVGLLPQDVIEPKLAKPGVGEVRVRALHDGRQVVFRLEWQDAGREVLLGPGQASDAAAVQLPGGDAPDLTDPAMGLHGRPVHITYWRAAWQETGDPVAALRPNMAIDHYPYQAAAPGARSAMETQYAPARGAGNPIAVRPVGTATQDLLAEGPGTLTAAREQRSTGRGQWQDGIWRVTLARPLVVAGASSIPVGRRTHVAFAVWDGGAGQAGSRKMRSVWLPLTLEAAP